MKELSIEERAKRYDKLFVKASRIYNKENDVLILHTIEDLFPELKESEDERIKEALIEYFRWNVQQILSDFDNKEVLAWLENIPYTIDHEKREGFHLGYKAGLEKQGKEDSSIQQAYEWGYTEGKRIERKHWVEKQKFSEDYNSIDPQFGKPIEQNPAWSEEDENNIDTIISVYHPSPKIVNWLKSLKQRATWKPSDAQMQALKEACDKHWEPDGLDPLYTLYEHLKKLTE